MSKVIPLHLISLARTTADWKCPRARYWGYEYEGRGITKSTTSLELAIGTAIHDATAIFATLTKEGQEVPIDEVGSTAFNQIHDQLMEAAGDQYLDEAETFANEQASLTEGLIRGFYKHVWPRLMNQYPEIVAIETEMDYPLDEEGSFVFRCKPDLIVADANGELVYLEYKSTSSKKPQWVNSWDSAVQLHSSVRAAEKHLCKPVSYVQIVGLYKGYESYGKQSSPFCYAYKKLGNPPFTKDQVSYEYKAGFKRFPIWEMDGGVKGWVGAMPENVLADQFPLTAPILVNDELVDAFFAQRLNREQDIVDGVELLNGQPIEGVPEKDELMNIYFPQKFDQCSPSFGSGCHFKPICFGEVANPLESGYSLREPHYKEEREAAGLDG